MFILWLCQVKMLFLFLYFGLTNSFSNSIVESHKNNESVVIKMEMHERIKELRKNHLHLSQTEFGDKLGVSRSVINNIERNVLARPEQKLSLMKLICSQFNVSEDWLLEGIEPMFVEPDTFSLDEFAKSRGATQIELDILKTYFEIEPDIRKYLIDHFRRNLFSNNSDLQIINSPVNPTAKSDDDIESELARYRTELEAEKKGKTLSALEEQKNA